MADESIPAALPPGWYVDPDNPDASRWWDGKRWTERKGPLVRASHPQRAVVRAEGKRPRGSLFNAEQDIAAGRNSAALLTFILCVVSVAVGFYPPLAWLSLLSALSAILFSIEGIRRYTQSLVGIWLAVTGLVIAVIMALLCLFYFVMSGVIV